MKPLQKRNGRRGLRSGGALTVALVTISVALYVTGGMDLQPGAETVTTGDDPSELSPQVVPIEAFPGDIPIKLESTSQFKGTVFSPGTDVHAGSDFEVSGRVRSFAWYESEFDWVTVGSVVQVKRDTFREAEAPLKSITDGTGVEIMQPVGARESTTDIAEWADAASGQFKCKGETEKALKWKASFTTEDWVVIRSIHALCNKELEKLSKEDIKMGGTGK
ncbi:MAG: hypothetical protein GY930_17490 [bacterium]|nr:hypothetical protein [bacterium]